MTRVIPSPAAASAQPDSQLPIPVADLLDDRAATQLLGDAGLAITRARPEYVRHKPGGTTLIGYRFTTPGGSTKARGYVAWCASTTRADAIARKAASLRPEMSAVGVSVVRVDAHAVFYGFPNDARLRRLRWFITPRKLKRVLEPLEQAGNPISKRATTASVLRYKPERRLVSRVDLGRKDGSIEPLLVRYTAERRADHLAGVAAALISHGVSTPTPRAQLNAGHVSVDEFIDGVDLRQWIQDRHGSIADELADSLHRFHSATPPPALPVRTEDDDLTNAFGGLSVLSLWNQDLGRAAATIAEMLRSARPGSPAVRSLIHGDLHDENILVSEHGPCVIDLERSAIGSPAADLGRLRAHAISLGIRRPGWSPSALPHAEQVIDHYRTVSTVASTPRRAPIDDAALSWHCAVALIDQALLVARHVEDGWRNHADALLAAAAEAVGPSRSPRRHHPHTQGAPPS